MIQQRFPLSAFQREGLMKIDVTSDRIDEWTGYCNLWIGRLAKLKTELQDCPGGSVGADIEKTFDRAKNEMERLIAAVGGAIFTVQVKSPAQPPDVAVVPPVTTGKKRRATD
jgi:hypothetical protein